jgi:hypothetical protein
MNATDIDNIAEREALAIAKLAAYQDDDPPQDRRVSIGRLIQLASTTGAEPAPHPRYARQTFVRWWSCQCATFAAGRIAPSPRIDFATHADLARRLARSKARQAKLHAMSRMSPRRLVTVPQASEVTGLSCRQIQRLILTGRIPARLDKHGIPGVRGPGKGTYHVRLGDVREYLAHRLHAA